MKTAIALVTAVVLLSAHAVLGKNHSADYQVGTYLGSGLAADGTYTNNVQCHDNIAVGFTCSGDSGFNHVALYKMKTNDGVWTLETYRQAEDTTARKWIGSDPVHFKKEKPNLLDALKPGDRVMFRVEYHRKLNGTEKDVFIPKADDPNKEEKFIGTFTPALAPTQPKPSSDNVRAMCDAHKLSPELEKQLCGSTIAATPLPSTADAGIQQIITNSEAAKSSPARAAALANVGHTQTPEELALLVQSGQASRCAVVTMPPGAEVFVDDNRLGISPVVFVLLKQGETPRKVTIKMAGYKTVEKNFVPDGKTIPIGLTLEKDSQ